MRAATWLFCALSRASLLATMVSGCTADILGTDVSASQPNDAQPRGTPTGTEGRPTDPACAAPQPGRAPLRRLTRAEYDHTLADLLGDSTTPGARLLTADSADDNADVRTVG